VRTTPHINQGKGATLVPSTVKLLHREKERKKWWRDWHNHLVQDDQTNSRHPYVHSSSHGNREQKIEWETSCWQWQRSSVQDDVLQPWTQRNCSYFSQGRQHTQRQCTRLSPSFTSFWWSLFPPVSGSHWSRFLVVAPGIGKKCMYVSIQIKLVA